MKESSVTETYHSHTWLIVMRGARFEAVGIDHAAGTTKVGGGQGWWWHTGARTLRKWGQMGKQVTARKPAMMRKVMRFDMVWEPSYSHV